MPYPGHRLAGAVSDYVRIMANPVPETTSGLTVRCAGLRCGRLMATGERLSRVVHEARWWRNPNAPDAVAYLCDECCARLGERLREAEPTPPRREPEPTKGRKESQW